MNKRKLLSLLLVLAMMLTLLPAPAAFAEGTTAPTEETTDPVENNDNVDNGGTVETPEAPTKENTEAPANAPAAEQPTVDEPSTLTDEAEVAEARDTSADEFYKILHLDCGRKYFTKDWIIALINEMAAAGYNQLQLAFGNDGLRFLLNDMSFTANGTTYSHDTVVSKVEAGNEAQNSSGDKRWLTEDEMDEIIAHANEKDIEIVPLLNLPGHANAILDIVDDAYNASGSGNTLDVATNDSAVNFGYAIFTKYVDYFAGKGCKFFSFGADEYANDASGTFSFSRLSSTDYAKFVAFINKLAAYIKEKDMTPRAFNDGLYYSGQSADIDTAIQCCYWSPGWNGYNVASATTISGKGHEMINTNGDYYYVLKENEVQNPVDKALNFKNTTFMDSTINNPAGSMFCIWCDKPNTQDETAVAKDVRMTLRKMAAAMQNTTNYSDEDVIVPGGFNADGTINGVVAETPTVKDADGNALTAFELGAVETATLTIGEHAAWTSSDENIVTLTSADTNGIALLSNVLYAQNVIATAVGAGTATITATTTSGSVELPVTVADTAATDENTIEINVDESTTVKVNGNNFESDSRNTQPDTNIATVNVTGVDEKAGGTDYIYTKASDVKCKDLADSNTDEKETNYYCLGTDGKYYRLYVKRDSGWGISYYYYYYYYYDANGNKVEFNNGNGYSHISPSLAEVDIDVYTQTETTTDSVAASTTIIFVGTGEGSTTVTVGDTTYTVKVDAPTTTESKTLNYDSSFDLPANAEVESGGDSSIVTVANGKVTALKKPNSTTVTVVTKNSGGKVTARYTYNITVIEEDLSAVTPLTIEYWITNRTVTANGVTSMELSATGNSVYGENGAAMADIAPKSGKAGDSDVEYWKSTRLTSNNKQTNDASVDKTQSGDDFAYIRYWNRQWAFSADGTEWTDIGDNDQLVAYYMQKTDVTDEVTTYVVDWGPKMDSWSDDLGYLQSDYVLLDYTVKYESGDETPNSFPSTKSLGFHCKDDKNNAATYRSLGRILAKETAGYEVYRITVTPSDDSQNNKLSGGNAASNRNYTYSGTETVAWAATEDDYTNSGLAKYTSISGKYTYTEGGEPTVSGLEIYNQHAMKVTFYVRAVSKEQLTVCYMNGTVDSASEFYSYGINVKSGTTFNENIALDSSNWKGDLTNGSVENDLGKTQMVSADLSTMPGIGAQYRYVDYMCTSVMRSDDGKKVYLYYTFNSAVTFVVDFGLPLVINPSDVSDSLIVSITKTEVNTGSSSCGTATVDNNTVTYTPDKEFAKAESGDTITITYTGTNVNGESDSVSYVVTILPASNVLYEENFFTTDENSGWEKGDTSTPTDSQQAQKTGDDGDYNVFGYDKAYQSATGAQGTYAATVEEGGTSTGALTTTFYGNGFDLIGTCSNNSGEVMIVIKDSKETPVKIVMVDTRLITNGKPFTQVPLAHVMLNEEDTYTVSIYAGAPTKSLAANADAEEIVEATPTYTVEIDSFRVYRSSDNTAYPENEKDVTYTNILKAVNGQITAWTDTVTGEQTISVEKYEGAGGPQNEIYLASGGNKFVQIKVEGANKIQVSLRAVDGETSWNNNTIKSNTEMYYEVDVTSGYATITNTGSGMLAIGNVKVPSGATVGTPNAADTVAMVYSLRMALTAAPDYDPITNVSVKSVNALRNKLVTLTVTTDTDVKTLTVNGKTLRPTNALAVKRGWSSEYIYVYADTVRKGETKDYTITATNADGLTATQTVQG